jgi:SAM-dependent methyltransferase
MGTAEDDVLSAQLAYYNSRAGEYDHDLYQDPASTDHIELLLASLRPRGRTLELACGTGVWTKMLATRVQSLTAIDGAPEMLVVARQRLGDTPVDLVETDLFDWQPDDRYDTVFFAFCSPTFRPADSTPSGERFAAPWRLEVECSLWTPVSKRRLSSASRQDRTSPWWNVN